MRPGSAFSALWYGSDRSAWHPSSLARRALGLALLPLSVAFRTSAAWKRRRTTASDPASRLAVPVVVVGNLIVGGTGKTPLAIALVDALRGAGYTPGIVSRGYGGDDVRRDDAIAAVDGAAPDAAERFGDEPVLMARRTGAPVFVGKRRPEVARALLAAHGDVDVVLSDDGLQHYALGRNFEIAVFDERGAGNRRVLPAGPLREPLARLAEVDAVVLNGEAAVLPTLPKGLALQHPPFRMTLEPGLAYRLNDPATRRPLSAFKGRRLTAAAGIGNPQRFFAMLRGVGLGFHRMALDDHHRYRDNPFEGRNSEAVLMTEKDAVKCERFEEARMWAVPVTARIDDALVERILGHIGGRKASAGPAAPA